MTHIPLPDRLPLRRRAPSGSGALHLMPVRLERAVTATVMLAAIVAVAVAPFV